MVGANVARVAFMQVAGKKQTHFAFINDGQGCRRNGVTSNCFTLVEGAMGILTFVLVGASVSPSTPAR
jgi:hypothetical protein